MATANFPVIWTVPEGAGAFPGTEALTTHTDQRLEFELDIDATWNGIAHLDPAVLGASPTITAVKLKVSLYANATTGVSRINTSYKTVADGETFNPATLTIAAAQNVTVPATAYLRKDLTFALTAGDFATDDLVRLALLHEGAHVNDTLAVNTLISTLASLEVTF